MGIVLRFVARPQGQDTVGFFISLHSPISPNQPPLLAWRSFLTASAVSQENPHKEDT
jgi:hypothetical protein